MIVKDFLLSLDREKLCKTYYEMYDAKDEVAQAEAKEGGYDLEERVTQCIHHCLDQFKDVEPVATWSESEGCYYRDRTDVALVLICNFS